MSQLIGLDPKIVSEIYGLLKKLNEEKKLTIIMISHDVHRVVKYASRIVEIENGTIKKDVSSAEYKCGGDK